MLKLVQRVPGSIKESRLGSCWVETCVARADVRWGAKEPLAHIAD